MRARGFSLVETMVAALVLAGGLLSLVAAMRGMARLDELGRREAEAAEAVSSQLARARTSCVSAAGNVASATIGAAFTHDARVDSVRVDASWWCGRAP